MSVGAFIKRAPVAWHLKALRKFHRFYQIYCRIMAPGGEKPWAQDRESDEMIA
jgi:hypothetical protein